MHSPPLFLLLYRASQCADLLFERTYASRDLSARQFFLLSAIELLGRPRQRDLAEATGADPATITIMLKVLERDGLVVKVPHPLEDLRANLVELTSRAVRSSSRRRPLMHAHNGRCCRLCRKSNANHYLSALISIATMRR
jgi:DNA-binding MarR family transcriptional regulator